jgi:hypothetical protein
MNDKTTMHKGKTLWGRIGSGETRYKTWGEGEYDFYWIDVGILAENCHGDRMAQCMVKGQTVTL